MAVNSVNPYDNLNSQVNKTNQYYVAKKSTNENAGQSLDMTDFLTLMVAMFQNQDIDNPADTSEMMSMMVNMSVVQAISDISQLISDSTNMTYGASLIGKEVTVGVYNDTYDDLNEIVGVVTGTGTMDGKQVIFIGNDTYLLSDVMAVGRLPEEDDGSSNKTETDSTLSSITSGEIEDNIEDDKVNSDPVEENGADIDPEA